MNWKSLFYKKSALNAEEEAPKASKQRERSGTAKDRKPNREGDNPYLSYRRRWNDHTGGILAQRNMWMIATLGLILITLASIGGIIHLSSQSKFVPYIVKVDKLGKALAYAPAERLSMVGENEIHSAVASFINDSRLVTPDVNLQRAAILRIYSALVPSEPAMMKMNEHLNGVEESNPFNRAATETVTIQFENILKQSGETWQVDWTETVRDRKGSKIKEPFRMRAIITVAIIPPDETTTEAQIRKNPLGIYMVDFDWSKTR